MAGFTHLHLHTQYSLLDGAIRVKDLFPKVKELGMDSVAVMELVSYFEEQLEVRIPDEELSRIRTVRDLRNTIARLLPDKQFAS